MSDQIIFQYFPFPNYTTLHTMNSLYNNIFTVSRLLYSHTAADNVINNHEQDGTQVNVYSFGIIQTNERII